LKILQTKGLLLMKIKKISIKKKKELSQLL
jgi:hypothetical protein